MNLERVGVIIDDDHSKLYLFKYIFILLTLSISEVC